MKRSLRRILIAAAVAALTLGVLCECATHVGRGWLFGEAFYEGRPTTWWRHRIDRWIVQCESRDAALESMRFLQIRCKGTVAPEWMNIVGVNADLVIEEEERPWITVLAGESEILVTLSADGSGFNCTEGPIPNPPPIWERVRAWLVEDDPDRNRPPDVLCGLPDAKAVLGDLTKDSKYHPFTDRAKQNTELVKRRIVFASPKAVQP